jgi:hypothetical protein
LMLFFMVSQLLADQHLLTVKLHDHTKTHHTQEDSSGKAISPLYRPLPDNNTQHWQGTDICVPSGIQTTHNPSKWAAAEPRLRPSGHWDQHWCHIISVINSIIKHIK